jgi:hypothetical protein
MGRIVIVACRPKAGRAAELRSLCAEHLAVLDGEGLVTARPGVLAGAADGTIVEVFEWVSAAAIERAHTNPVIQQLWARFAEVCEYVPIGSVPEAAQLFSEFDPLN